MKKFITIITMSTSIALLAGCGGGGGGAVGPTGPVASSLSFPLQTGYKALVTNGGGKTFTISGTCSGSGSLTRAPATTPATFETVTGFSAAETISYTYTNCTPASTAQTATLYYDSNYVPLGMNSVGVNYGVWLTPPVIPTSVTVGGTAIIGTETLYTNSTKLTGNGRVDESYVIEADTATTAIVNLIDKVYTAASTLSYTEQDRYRVTSTGGLTLLSVDMQVANSSTHIVWTMN